MAKVKLTLFSKLLLTLLIVAAIVSAGYYLLNETELGRQLQEKSQQEYKQSEPEITDPIPTTTDSAQVQTSKAIPSLGALKVQIYPSGGFAPGLYFNGGAKHNPDSKFFKNYGLQVDFVVMDDPSDARQDWKDGKIQIMADRIDGVILNFDELKRGKPEIFLQTDWSRGADVIVAQRGIDNINDLKGKKIACTPNSPSMTYLALALSTAGMKLDDVVIINAPDDATTATVFNSGSVDAAVVKSPAHIQSLKVIKGAHILQSTKDAAFAQTGVLYTKRKYISKYKDQIRAFYAGWMDAVAEIKTAEEHQNSAVTIMANTFNISAPDARRMISDIYLCSHGDNLNYFGLDNSFAGVTGSQLYMIMTDLLKNQKVIPKKIPSFWSITNSRIASSAQLSGDGYEPERADRIRSLKATDSKDPAISIKDISIKYGDESDVLSANAKTIIDLEFADIARIYASSRIRIESNTDNIGDSKTNKRLSVQRALAVATYLRIDHQIDVNRLIAVGNGSDKPVNGCETNATATCRAKNRRTEFHLLARSQ